MATRLERGKGSAPEPVAVATDGRPARVDGSELWLELERPSGGAFEGAIPDTEIGRLLKQQLQPARSVCKRPPPLPRNGQGLPGGFGAQHGHPEQIAELWGSLLFDGAALQQCVGERVGKLPTERA